MRTEPKCQVYEDHNIYNNALLIIWQNYYIEISRFVCSLMLLNSSIFLFEYDSMDPLLPSHLDTLRSSNGRFVGVHPPFWKLSLFRDLPGLRGRVCLRRQLSSPVYVVSLNGHMRNDESIFELLPGGRYV